MNFTRLESFVNLIDLGSYTETSKKLHISQPTVTSHIKALEDNLGVKLVRKSWKRYETTEIGSLIYAYALQILNLRDKIYDLTRDKTKEEDQDTIKITTTDKGAYIIPEITQKFEENYPEIRLFFTISNSSTALSQFQDGTIDCLITPYTREMKSLKDVRIFELGKDHLYLATSLDSPLSKKSLITKEDLVKETFIIREEGSETRRLSINWMLENDLVFANTYEMNYSETIARAVQKNIGISILPKTIKAYAIGEINFLEDIKGLPIERNYILIAKDMDPKIYEDLCSISKEAFKNIYI